MMMHPDHALLVSAVRHRELVAEAEEYRRGLRATTESCPHYGDLPTRPESSRHHCRPHPGQHQTHDGRGRFAPAGACQGSG